MAATAAAHEAADPTRVAHAIRRRAAPPSTLWYHGTCPDSGKNVGENSTISTSARRERIAARIACVIPAVVRRRPAWRRERPGEAWELGQAGSGHC
jgi:hypothetical protein